MPADCTVWLSVGIPVLVFGMAGLGHLAHPKSSTGLDSHSKATWVQKLKLVYAPILQQPPLHLVVMGERESDLTIDYAQSAPASETRTQSTPLSAGSA